jgi:hypothetical protein
VLKDPYSLSIAFPLAKVNRDKFESLFFGSAKTPLPEGSDSSRSSCRAMQWAPDGESVGQV